MWGTVQFSSLGIQAGGPSVPGWALWVGPSVLPGHPYFHYAPRDLQMKMLFL